MQGSLDALEGVLLEGERRLLLGGGVRLAGNQRVAFRAGVFFQTGQPRAQANAVTVKCSSLKIFPRR